MKQVIDGFIASSKDLCLEQAKLLHGELSAGDRALVELGFAHGLKAANQMNKIIDKTFKGGGA